MTRGNYEDFPALSRDRANREFYYESEAGGDKPLVPDLTDLTVSTLDLKNELLEQYNRARKLLHEASYNAEVPLNQKASVINSATSILAALTKSQAELHSVEEVKKLELALVTALKKFPELQEEFMKVYKAAGELYSV